MVVGVLAALLLSGCGGSAEAVDVAPSLLPRTRQAVEASGRILYGAGGRIWEWSEGAGRALTKPGERWEGATWSPDGQTIAASEVGDNHSDVYLLDPSGNRVRQLTRHWSHVSVQQSAWGRKPAWSPDGSQLAYVSDLWQSDMSLWSVGVRGGDNRRRWNMPLGSGGLDWPSWSPDKKKIAFTSYTPGPYDRSQVFVLNLETGLLTQLTELKDGAFDPAWSPDGSTIAFAGRYGTSTRILTARADGSGLVRLTEGTLDRAPSWSPDGEEVAYLSITGMTFDLWAVRVTSSGVSEPRQLTSGQGADTVSGVSWAR